MNVVLGEQANSSRNYNAKNSNVKNSNVKNVMLKTRILTAAVLMAIFIPALFKLPESYWALAMLIVTLLALRELFASSPKATFTLLI